MGGRDHSQFWCILRTSGAKTLPLMRSLAEAGMEVWTPRAVLDRKMSKKKDAPEIEMPIAPTFVFARASHLHDLAIICDLPLSHHPDFSIFRFAGRIPLITDIEIVGFRAAEESANLSRRKTRHRDVEPGQRVRFSEGAYAGLTGVVKKRGAQYSAVIFADKEIKIATWLLSENVVGDDSSPLGSAAKAA